MVELTAPELKDLIKKLSALEDGNPPSILAVGDCGCGKSSSVEAAAKELNKLYIPISLSRCEPYDLRGLPSINNSDYVSWRLPNFYKDIIESDGNAIVCFDEFTACQQDTANAVLDIILQKKVDEVLLPRRTMFVLLGNRGGEDGTMTKAISAAVINRCLVVNICRPSLKQWVEFEKPTDIVRNFLEAMSDGSHLYIGPDMANRFSPFCTPRSWSLLDRLVKQLYGLTAGSGFSSSEKKQIVIFAKSVLSPGTAAYFEDFIMGINVDARKLIAGSEAELKKFKELDTFRQAFVINNVADLPEVKEIKNEDDGAPVLLQLQHFLDVLCSLKQDLAANFTVRILKTNPVILRKLSKSGSSLLDWAEKLLQLEERLGA